MIDKSGGDVCRMPRSVAHHRNRAGRLITDSGGGATIREGTHCRTGRALCPHIRAYTIFRLWCLDGIAVPDHE
jgi:hypothetical protein